MLGDSGRHLDYDPPPRRSPRLFAQMGDVAGSVAPASTRPPRLTERQRDRLARDLMVYLAIEGGMSYRTAGRALGLTHSAIFKAYSRVVCRKSRV